MASVKFVSDFGAGRLYSLEGVPGKNRIICSSAFRRILYNPRLAGKDLQDAMEDAGAVFVKAMSGTALKNVRKKNLVELVYLSGGLFYGILPGFKRVHNFAIPQCFMGIKRFKVKGTKGSFIARATYENFEALPDDAVVIIADTLATGATMAKGLEVLGKALSKQKKRMKKLIVCTIAGCSDGLLTINSAVEKLKKTNPGLEFHFFAAEQLFTLMPDGTDLRFLESKSIMPEETKEYTLNAYGEWLGRNMKCAVFDWGTRCKNPAQHYKEFIEYAETASKSASPEAKAKLNSMISEAKMKLEELSEKISGAK